MVLEWYFLLAWHLHERPSCLADVWYLVHEEACMAGQG